MEVEGARLAFPYGGIAEAKLVLTNRLVEEDLKARKPSA